MRIAPSCCLFLLVGSLGLACSSDDASSADAAPSAIDGAVTIDADLPIEIDAALADFSLASTAIVQDGVIPTVYTCQGANISPPLSWANPPEGTQAFALVFKDLTIDFLHSAMWDIPVSTLALPEDVEQVFEPADVAGAKQPNSYAGTRGYAGPCPGNEHTYEFRLHAVDAATLSGLSNQSSRAQVVAAIEAASLGSVALSANFDPANP